MGESEHIAVMANEAVEALAPCDGGRYIDATFGRGGYARRILDAAPCRLLGLDRDPTAIIAAATLVRNSNDRFVFINARFGELADTADGANFVPADGVVMDLGVSSPQLDDPRRGFSFRADGPLDMRMERAGPSAADIVNAWTEDELTDVFRELGEERGARRAPSAKTGRSKGPQRSRACWRRRSRRFTANSRSIRRRAVSKRSGSQ